MDGKEFPLRNVCCAQSMGVIRVAGGQNVVRCRVCGVAKFNAPKSETGEATRSVTPEREAVKPKQRARIIERDGFRCWLCGIGADAAILHAGHILSVDDAMAEKLTPEQYNDDENLIAMCEQCNLGLGKQSLRVRTVISILIRRAAERAA